MLGRTSTVRHATVVASIGTLTALTGFGLIGGGKHEERFDAWTTVVEPAGGDGVRITEYIDQDFGDADRHGPLRDIPNDFGIPTDVVATSPDAPADVNVIPFASSTEIRVGDADTTVSGQHRYVLSYTLPNARVSTGFLALDVLAGDEFETDVASVVVNGFRLTDPGCFVGATGSTDRCELVADGPLLRADIAPLPTYTGITIDGTIDGTFEPVAVEAPPIPPRRDGNQLPMTLGMAGLGIAGAAPVYGLLRRRGRNEVYAGGAAEAAYGALPPPGAAGAAPGVPVTLVADDDLADLATIEFAPPKGLEPWEAAALLFERVDDSTVEAWVSGLAGREVLELGDDDGKLTIGAGAKRSAANDIDNGLIAQLQGGTSPYVTGKYDPAFARAWGAVLLMQRQRIQQSGWWKHGSPGAAPKADASVGVVILVPILFIVLSRAGGSVFDVFRHWPVALAVGLLVPMWVAYLAYKRMLPARSAQGSALALRVESFRRFLHASESQHVEWAWSKGLLREYSGWAVALGEADAWGKALAGANVPAPARSAIGPIVATRSRASMGSSRTKPSSSSSGGGGHSGGGSVGGGGGGGSRGSW